MNTKQSEISLQKQICDWLNYQGHYVWRTNTGTMFIPSKKGFRCFKCGFKGLADINGVLRDGRFIAVEVKVGRNKVSKEQNQFIEEVRSRGGIGLVARDLEQVMAAIKEI